MTSSYGIAVFSASEVEGAAQAAQAATAAAVCAFGDAFLRVDGVSLLFAAVGVVCNAATLPIHHAR